MKLLFVIVHESCVPRNSDQYKKIEKIKRNYDYKEAPLDLSPEPKEAYGDKKVFVCDAFTMHCVLEHARNLRKIGVNTTVYEPASVFISEL